MEEDQPKAKGEREDAADGASRAKAKPAPKGNSKAKAKPEGRPPKSIVQEARDVSEGFLASDMDHLLLVGVGVQDTIEEVQKYAQ